MEDTCHITNHTTHVTEPETDWYSVFLLASTGVFSVEYLLRLWSCVEDERYHGAVLGRCVCTTLLC